jgi:nitrite reductase/ring-hydroxylating ferredoxin subunit
MTLYVLVKTGELNELQARGFDLAPPDETGRILVIKRDDRLFAYRNVCPHTGAPLNWYGDRFLDSENRYLQCALHGALFKIENGYCIAGPCSGQSLIPIPFHIDNGHLLVDL